MEGKRSSKERGGAGKSEEEHGGTRRSREEQGKTERSRERGNFHFSSLKLLFLVSTYLIVKYGSWKRMQTEGRYQWTELWKASVPLSTDSVVSLSPAHPWVPDSPCHNPQKARGTRGAVMEENPSSVLRFNNWGEQIQLAKDRLAQRSRGTDLIRYKCAGIHKELCLRGIVRIWVYLPS